MRTALITGASRGLGRAVAGALAARGVELIVDARGAAALDDAAGQLRRHTTVTAIAGDIIDEDHRIALARAAGRTGLDLVVHNAGILGPSPLPELAELYHDDLRELLEVTVIAPVRLTQLLLPHLRPAATIVAVTSDAAVDAYPGWGAYGAAKAAFEHVFAVLGAERPDLTVHRVDPGDLRTVMHQQAFPGEDISDRPPPEAAVPGILALLDRSAPSGRYRAGDPREVVDAIVGSPGRAYRNDASP